MEDKKWPWHFHDKEEERKRYSEVVCVQWSVFVILSVGVTKWICLFENEKCMQRECVSVAAVEIFLKNKVQKTRKGKLCASMQFYVSKCMLRVHEDKSEKAQRFSRFRVKEKDARTNTWKCFFGTLTIL